MSRRDQHHPARGRRPLVEPVNPHLDRGATDALLVAAGRGDLSAFATFYDQTAAAVFGLLRAVLGDPARAEQATERVYLHLWRTAARFDPHGRSAYALLLHTARRELITRVHDLLAPTLPTVHTRQPATPAAGRPRVQTQPRCDPAKTGYAPTVSQATKSRRRKMDKFVTAAAGEAGPVPEKLQALFNDHTAVRVQPLPCALPGRTMPHKHENGQHMIVTEGVGVIADEQAVYVVRPGDVVTNPPGGWHWHGATPTTAMSHVTVEGEDAGLDLDVERLNWDEVYTADLGTDSQAEHRGLVDKVKDAFTS